jgi:hypothetical protein
MEMTMIDRAAKRRGADPAVPEKAENQKIGAATEKKLEQGLEESMAGSDPVSITQPVPAREPNENPNEE